jgi:CspA family cold shock protein
VRTNPPSPALVPFQNINSCIRRFAVQPDAGGRDVFVRISAAEKAGLGGQPDGAKVSYDIVANGGKETAENLRMLKKSQMGSAGSRRRLFCNERGRQLKAASLKPAGRLSRSCGVDHGFC